MRWCAFIGAVEWEDERVWECRGRTSSTAWRSAEEIQRGSGGDWHVPAEVGRPVVYRYITSLGRRLKNTVRCRTISIWNHTDSKNFHITFAGISGWASARNTLSNVVITCEIKLFQPSSTSVWYNLMSLRGNLPEIISKSFHRCIDGLTSLRLKYYRSTVRVSH